MKTDVDKLRGKMAERRVSQEEISSKLGMNPSTFYRKMKSDGLTFTVGQMHKIVEVLDISPDEAKSIFLNRDSH